MLRHEEKTGQELMREAKKLGVATDGIREKNGSLREGALQQRVRNAKNTRYAQLGWLLALLSAVAATLSAVAAWLAVNRVSYLWQFFL